MDPAEDWQQRGQEAYRRKEYDLALSLFSQALDCARLPVLQVGILDNRAATHEKLGTANLSAALRDARQMIKLQKTSARGYLRAGKILQLKGEDDAALATYEYGLRKIPDTDENAKRLLGGMYKKLRDRLHASNPTRCADPFRALPIELVEMILSDLPFHCLMLIGRVSKGWRDLITHRPRSYATLDFSAAVKPVSIYTIKTYIKRARGNVRNVVTSKRVQSNKALMYVAEQCKQLSKLRITGPDLAIEGLKRATEMATNLSTLVVNCPTTLSAVIDIINLGRNLETLEFDGILTGGFSSPAWNPKEHRNLRKFVMRWENISAPRALIDITKAFPLLRELELELPSGMELPEGSLSGLSMLEVLKIEGTRLASYPALPVPSRLRHLDLSYSLIRFDASEDIEQCPLPLLEVLNVAGNPRISKEDVLRILEPCSQNKTLKVLDISMCPRIDVDSLDWLLDAGHGDSLQELSLAGDSEFGDQATKELGRLCNLRRLNLALTSISGIGVLNLVNRKTNKIEWLGLDDCNRVMDDAVELVRKRGIGVSYRRDTHQRGKRVRYGD